MAYTKFDSGYIITLDQYCTSNMFGTYPPPLWAEISELLKTRHAEGKLLCPVPYEHFLETAQRTYDLGIAAIQGHIEISGGYIYLNEPFITANLIITGLRQQDLGWESFFNRDTVVFEKQENFRKVQEAKQEFDNMAHAGLKGVNDFRIHTRNLKMDKGLKDLFLKAILSTEVSRFTQRIRQVINDKSITIRAARFGDKEIPNGVDQLLYVLMNTYQMTLPESLHLLIHMETKGFAGIPTLDVLAHLKAHNAIEHKSEQGSDQIDFMRISCGLPASDILFTDKRRKNKITEMGLDQKYHCRVYCGSDADLKDFRDFLYGL